MGSPLQFGLIGDPVSHSLSPVIYDALFGHYHIAAQYHLYPVHAEGISAFIVSLPALKLRGFNITMPHKRAVIPYLHKLEVRARRMQSVNTVCIEDGRLLGYTTDGQGFAWALAQKGVFLEGQHVLLLGAGGAAGAVALECVLQHAGSLTILNRTPEAAQELTAWLPAEQGLRISLGSLDPSEIMNHARNATLLVNATPLGMQGRATDFPDFDFLDTLPAGAMVNDLIYHPAQTSLLREADMRGFRTANGLGMLIGQALAAFTHFTGIVPDDGAVRDITETLRKARPELNEQA